VLRLQRSIVPFHARLKFDSRGRHRFLRLGTNLILPARGASSGSAAPSSGFSAVPGRHPYLPLPRVIVKPNFLLRKPNKRSRTASRLMRPIASAWIRSDRTAL
jgi:hypothetical protein